MGQGCPISGGTLTGDGCLKYCSALFTFYFSHAHWGFPTFDKYAFDVLSLFYWG